MRLAVQTEDSGHESELWPAALGPYVAVGCPKVESLLPEGGNCAKGNKLPFPLPENSPRSAMESCFSDNLVAEGDAWRRDLLAFCVLLCAMPWTAKTLIRKGARLTGQGCRKGRLEGVCVARRTGLASLQFSCPLIHAVPATPGPQGRASHLAEDSTQTTATCGSKKPALAHTGRWGRVSQAPFFLSAQDSNFAEREWRLCLAPRQPAAAFCTASAYSTCPNSCSHPNHCGFLSPWEHGTGSGDPPCPSD